MRWSAVGAITGVVAAVHVAHADETVVLRGTVIERDTKAPVAGAIVTVAGQLVATDDDGHFAVNLRPGRYVLEVTAEWLTPAKAGSQAAPSKPRARTTSSRSTRAPKTRPKIIRSTNPAKNCLRVNLIFGKRGNPNSNSMTNCTGFHAPFGILLVNFW